MVCDRPFLFHMCIPCAKKLSFSFKVKVICKGQLSRSPKTKNKKKNGYWGITNTACFFYCAYIVGKGAVSVIQH